MVILLEIALALLGALLVASALVGIPGTWLFLAACVAAEMWVTEDLFRSSTLLAAVGIATVGEVLEFTSGSRGARRAGATRAGAIGALIGGALGAMAGTFLIPVPLLGTLAGASVGAFALATVLERRGGKELRRALRAGTGAALGQVQGMVFKLAAGIAVWLLLSIALFVP